MPRKLHSDHPVVSGDSARLLDLVTCGICCALFHLLLFAIPHEENGSPASLLPGYPGTGTPIISMKTSTKTSGGRQTFPCNKCLQDFVTGASEAPSTATMRHLPGWPPNEIFIFS